MIQNLQNRWRLCALLTSLPLAAACGSMQPVPKLDDRVVTVEIPRIVEVPCADRRPTADEYPDTDEKLAQIAEGDFEALGKASRAGRDLRDARLKTDDAQIKGCANPDANLRQP